MIYQTGTIATTAGQTKITGTGTRWKDNLAGISEGCPISYLINNVVYMNTVLSVNSDTEINLTYPVPVAATAAKYQIATFVLDSMSDGVRKMLANQQYIQYFLRNMDSWMTQDGIVEIKTPTGETVKFESIIALKKLIDGKFDKKGGDVNGAVKATGLVSGSALAAFKDGASIELNFDGEFPRIVTKNKNGGYRAQVFQDKAGVLMHVGDFGLGFKVLQDSSNGTNTNLPAGFYAVTGGSNPWSTNGSGHFINIQEVNSYGFQIGRATSQSYLSYRVQNNGVLQQMHQLYSTANTTKDSNGNLKAASPIIKVFADHIELNDESEGVELEKLGTGRYKLKGTLGMNSDASWGGCNGGLVAPLGINGLELLWVDYKVLSDGDIIIETNYRKHSDLPPPVLLKQSN